MKYKLSHQRAQYLADLEGDDNVSAGTPPWSSKRDKRRVESPIPFALGRLVNLLRRKEGKTIEQLANALSVDIAELLQIEQNTQFVPQPRTVHYLASHYGLSPQKLMAIAGILQPKSSAVAEEALRFAARTVSHTELSDEERSTLEDFVRHLSASC